MGALVVAMVSAWIAVGQLAAATEAGLSRTAQALTTARTVAANTAKSAGELQRMVTVVADGIGSVGEAVTATKGVSASTRQALSKIRFIDSVQDVRKNLEEAEASLDKVRADLDGTGASLHEAVPTLNETVAALQEVPAELDRSIDQVSASLDKVVAQRRLWRVAIVASTLGLLGGLLVLERLVRDTSPPAAPA